MRAKPELQWFSMFEALRKTRLAQSRPRATRSWRCPSCLARVDASHLEWRCPSEECRLQKGPVDFQSASTPIMDAVEQSYPCPIKGCFVVHTQPFVKGCDRHFGHNLYAPDEDVHHVIATSPEGNSRTAKLSVAGLSAALLLAEEIVTRGVHPVQPIDVPSRRALDRKASVRRRGAAAAAGTIGVRRSPGNQLLYIHQVMFPQPQSIHTDTTIGKCSRSRMAIAARVGLANTLALALTTEGAISARASIQRFSTELGESLMKGPWQKSPPSLLVVLTDEEQLACHLGADFLPGLRETREDLRGEVLDGYVLDGLQLREPLGPLLELPWHRVSVASLRFPLNGPDALAGFGPWLDMIIQDR